jgi:MoaA/NifB/PqqE/SkfB family radical SAM enzyme
MCPYHPPEGVKWESVPHHNKVNMKLDMCKSVLNDAADLGTQRIAFVGEGEPFLNKSIMDMIEHAKSLNLWVLVFTNGSLLDEEKLQQLISLELTWLRVSLNAGRPETYPLIHTTENVDTFYRIKDCLFQLSRLKRGKNKNFPQLELSFIIQKQNLHEIEDMIKIAIEVGAQKVSLEPMYAFREAFPLGLNSEDVKEYKNILPRIQKLSSANNIILKADYLPFSVPENEALHSGNASIYFSIPCYVGWWFSKVMADGIVNPCCNCFTVMGDTTQQSFKEIWFSETYKEFRRNAKKFPHLGKIPGCCEGCNFERSNISTYNSIHIFRKEKNHRVVKARNFLDLFSG